MKSRRRQSLAVLALLLAITSNVSARKGRDTVEIVETPAGTYLCCYDFLVTNRTDSATKISEFRFRIVSGRARFITGQTDAPFMWTSQQDSTQVIWQSTGAAYDIPYGATVTGFHICPRDTGIVRFVWETRTIDSVISNDTVTLACRGIDCDEAFFRVVPSTVGAVVDVDLVAGNHTGGPINDFHLHPLTPGVSFRTTPTPTPAGWNRTKARADTLVWSTVNAPLYMPGFIENFRFEMEAPTDSAIRMEYWTTTFGTVVCRDTVTIQWGLSRRDSVRSASRNDTCCLDITLTNRHEPTSDITVFTLKVTTPGVRIEGFDLAPPAWRQLGPFGSGDSIAFVAAEPLTHRDSALFQSLCFNNAGATTDTINWRWRTFTRNAIVDQGTGRRFCIRPLTTCDSVSMRIDSTYPAPERCVYFFLKNTNSRNAAISRLTLKASNPGTARRIRSATPPPGWQVESFGGDTVVFIGNALVAGDTISPFALCLSNGDSATRDPLTIRWTTANGLGPICTGTLSANAIINADCDIIEWTQIPSNDSNESCFRLRVLNRNGRNRQIDRIGFVVDLPVIFANASASAPWSVDAPAFPSFDCSFVGGTIEPDSASPEFTLCIDIRQLPTLPATVPVAWSTYTGRSILCTDTVRLVCRDVAQQACDEADVTGVRLDECTKQIVVRNLHQPPGSIDGIDIRVPHGCSIRGITESSPFAQATHEDSIARLRGGALQPGDSTTFTLVLDPSCDTGSGVILSVTTLEGSTQICVDTALANCAEAGAPSITRAMSALSVTPNPTRGDVVVSFELIDPQPVAIAIRDLQGRELRRVEAGLLTVGAHTLTMTMDGLSSGVYFVLVTAGHQTRSEQVTLAR